MPLANMLTMNQTYRNSPVDRTTVPAYSGAEAKESKGAAPLAEGYGYDIANGVAGPVGAGDKADELKKRFDSYECKTCKNRKYVDGSNDPGVSFKTPGRIKPEAAAAVVRRHEGEHVSRNRAKAQREGGEVVSQSVVLKTAICPECHRSYVSGGETRTVTSTPVEKSLPSYDGTGNLSEKEEKGQYMDIVA